MFCRQVFQLETAMGSAIESFDDSGAVVVPRSRFAPVKTTNDLFVLRSDAYNVRRSRPSTDLPLCIAACGAQPVFMAQIEPTGLHCAFPMSFRRQNESISHFCIIAINHQGPAKPRGFHPCTLCCFHTKLPKLYLIRPCDLHPQLTKESTVVLARGSAPNVKLDDKFYKLVDKMEVRRRPSLR